MSGQPSPRILVLVETEEEAQLARAAGAEALLRTAGGVADGEFTVVDAARPDTIAWDAVEEQRIILFTVHEGRLLDRLGFPAVADLAASARRRGCSFGFAGALEAADMPRLMPLAPRALLFDRGVRETAGALDPARLRDVVQLARPLPAIARDANEKADRVFIRNLVEELELGAYASERGRRQRVRFSIEADLAPVRRARSLRDIFSYDRMLDAVRALAARAPEPFVETLAEALAAEMLADPRVEAVTVRVEKLDLGPEAAGIEIRRLREA